MSGQTKPDTKESAHPPADRSAMIHYAGFHGTTSRCHVVHRRLDDRTLFAFGNICGARGTRSATATMRVPVKRAAPINTVMFGIPASQSARPRTARFATGPLHAITAAMSTKTTIGPPPRQMCKARAGHHRLGRRAPVVDAGATEMLALDQRHAAPGCGQTRTQERTGLAGPDDDGVELFHAGASPAALG